MEAPARRLVTRQRIETLEELRASDAFLTAQELHTRLTHSGSRVGLSTVYRTLEYLLGMGKIDMIRDLDNVARYRVCRKAEHHHHLRCRGCQRSIELADSEIEEWARNVARRHRYANVSHEVELVGECRECRRGTI